MAYLVFQDEKAQLLITYLWLHYVSAITHVNTTVSDGVTIWFSVVFCECCHMTYGFVILVVEERVCLLGPNPVWHRQDFPPQKKILVSGYCNQ